MTDQRTAQIARLNDACRVSTCGHMVTVGVDALGPDFVLKAYQELKAYDDFSSDNDPYGEHDFGVMTVDGTKLYWKIDYYDKSREYGSDDPADPDVTCRVLTIMLASEY